ncbi:hypothetical protein EYF80_032875 [Liparis tanakae]|uniref:Uncharacterized protein n=1 Tax=Liparis tanakae TaxID=230148 RepID=A0A4Z2GUV4_9TELE|nr:hypothetical protein EYF80_032875 [Liparis tanakae]
MGEGGGGLCHSRYSGQEPGRPGCQSADRKERIPKLKLDVVAEYRSRGAASWFWPDSSSAVNTRPHRAAATAASAKAERENTNTERRDGRGTQRSLPASPSVLIHPLPRPGFHIVHTVTIYSQVSDAACRSRVSMLSHEQSKQVLSGLVIVER